MPKLAKTAFTSVTQPVITGALLHEKVRVDTVFAGALGTLIGTTLGASIRQTIERTKQELTEYEQAHTGNDKVELEPLPAYLHKDYVRLQQQHYKQAKAWLDEMTSDAPLPYLASTSSHSSNHHQPSNTTRSSAWLNREMAEARETYYLTHWKPDYNATHHASERFIHWQQEVERNNQPRQSKWERFKDSVEVLTRPLGARD